MVALPTRSPAPRRATAALACAFAHVGCRGPTSPTAAPAPAEPPESARCERADHNECYVRVEGATFWMGAQATDPAGPAYDPAAEASEGPPHQAAVDAFWILRSEVTVSTLQRCVLQKACPAELAHPASPFANGTTVDRRNHPINAVRWADAAAICAFLGGRLPTEAEWELAARGTDGRRWPWGNEPACGVPEAQRPDPGGAQAAPRMATPPCHNDGTVFIDARAFGPGAGLPGLAGNVAEWTSDLWHGYGAPAAEGETRRVLRGGGWMSTDPNELRTTVRTPAAPDEQAPDVGFRCVWGKG